MDRPPDIGKRVHYVSDEGDCEGECRGALVISSKPSGKSVLGVLFDGLEDGIKQAVGEHEDNVRPLRREADYDEDGDMKPGTYHLPDDCEND
jgi:hypothetical protein